MFEEWVKLEEFPGYSISDLGNVRNDNTGKPVAKSLTLQGGVKVGLVKDRKQRTRSVAVMVAHIFVDGYTEENNTPIHLDADQQNCEAVNLMWRPRWMANRYHRQFTDAYSESRETYGPLGPIVDLQSGTIYQTIQEAAQQNGLLISSIHRNVMQNYFNRGGHVSVYPTGQHFSYVNIQAVFEK